MLAFVCHEVEDGNRIAHISKKLTNKDHWKVHRNKNIVVLLWWHATDKVVDKETVSLWLQTNALAHNPISSAEVQVEVVPGHNNKTHVSYTFFSNVNCMPSFSAHRGPSRHGNTVFKWQAPNFRGNIFFLHTFKWRITGDPQMYVRRSPTGTKPWLRGNVTEGMSAHTLRYILSILCTDSCQHEVIFYCCSLSTYPQ